MVSRTVTIDVIATDHAGFTVAEKDVPLESILSAPPGHPGVEILVPFTMTEALCGKFSLSQAVEPIRYTSHENVRPLPCQGSDYARQ